MSGYSYLAISGGFSSALTVEVVKLIYDRYIHTNDGLNGVAKYLNDHGYRKKIRQNGIIPGFSSNFVKDVLDNPVYMGKSPMADAGQKRKWEQEMRCT